MNHCGIQQSTVAALEEVKSSVSLFSDKKVALVCPKPRRLGQLNTAVNNTVRPFRLHFSNQQEGSDTRAVVDILEDIILAKGGYGAAEQTGGPHQVASSPPFFCGSPPRRVSNPVIMDVRFGDEQQHETPPASPRTIPTSSPIVVLSPSASTGRKGGCVRANFGNNPAVRIEGFDCLDSDRRNCSIPALA
ncbi:unnamed protein product [Cuscuta campestris]|uniref:Uncharacterized protein n=2 Tax=Cuscuta sect. Cleistogrammica TaxID=1824901 RepID=A0A484MAG3_9ASTE|nr:hypothetical protein DM860_002247 [Cuscuta australis]VFQ85517.1 unnamed protein product [Cuscuta campestris]